MEVLLAQLDPPHDVDEGASRVAGVIAERPGADLAVFPELFLGGYGLDRLDEIAIDLDSAALESVRVAARDAATAVIVGFAERRDVGVCNSLALIDDRGGLADVYRKAHLFGAEAEVFLPGDRLLVVELAGWRVGPMICFDVELCEPARALARAGAELLVTASSNMEPYFNDHLLASQARALDNRRPHLYLNRVGSEGAHRFVGGTRSINPDGTVATRIDGAGEGILRVEVERAEPDPAVDYLLHAREDLAVVEPSTTGGTR